jgi:hypothetical protein
METTEAISGVLPVPDAETTSRGKRNGRDGGDP